MLDLQDIVGINSARSYIFVHLNPGTTYSISVSARNAEGPGPEAFLQSTTLPLEKCITTIILHFYKASKH